MAKKIHKKKGSSANRGRQKKALKSTRKGPGLVLEGIRRTPAAVRVEQKRQAKSLKKEKIKRKTKTLQGQVEQPTDSVAANEAVAIAAEEPLTQVERELGGSRDPARGSKAKPPPKVVPKDDESDDENGNGSDSEESEMVDPGDFAERLAAFLLKKGKTHIGVIGRGLPRPDGLKLGKFFAAHSDTFSVDGCGRLSLK